MCLLLVLSPITPSLIKCKYNISLKLEKRFPMQYIMDALGLVLFAWVLDSNNYGST
jgi:hypothetical protein